MKSPTVPLIPETAPFTAEQRAWLNGFLAGLFSRGTLDPAAARLAGQGVTENQLQRLTILFGSQTGTAEGLARRAARQAGRCGFAATVADMASFDPARLAAEPNLLVITSTYGDGDPPDNARALHAALQAETAPRLENVRFSVCALGDSNYAQFCRCGREFDTLLEQRGGTRVAPRADCDVDFETPFETWLQTALAALGATEAPAVAAAGALAPSAEPATSAGGHSRQHPFPAPVRTVRRLTGDRSVKEVWHVELDLAGSGLAYEPGDALGVLPRNRPDLVGEILTALGCDGEEAVPTPAGELPLRTALLVHFDLGRPTAGLHRLLAPASAPAGRPETETPPADAYPQNWDVLDLLRAVDVRPAPVDFVAQLRRLQPRLYSIASSPRAHAGAVHLTVGAVRYQAGGRTRQGVCSTFLADQAEALGRVEVFVHANRGFRLPADGATPMIMIGPGTGIAPFRAFLHERRALGATGRHWLFFGGPHAATDYLYGEEIEAFQRDGLLHRLDLAWSRDQRDKVYVQHRMATQAAELFSWLETGAHLYVCGDAARMAKDVHAALLRVIETAGARSPDAAAEYLARLQADRRYVRDVY